MVLKRRARPPWVVVTKCTPLWGEPKPGPLGQEIFLEENSAVNTIKDEIVKRLKEVGAFDVKALH